MAPYGPVYLLASGRQEPAEIDLGSPQDQVFSLGVWYWFSSNLMLLVFWPPRDVLLMFVLVVTSLVKGKKLKRQNAKTALLQAVATSVS